MFLITSDIIQTFVSAQLITFEQNKQKFVLPKICTIKSK